MINIDGRIESYIILKINFIRYYFVIYIFFNVYFIGYFFFLCFVEREFIKYYINYY